MYQDDEYTLDLPPYMDPDPGDIVSISFSMMFNAPIPSFITIKSNT